MGTTLTGTTPANTYDSLIKVTDNGPISGTLKALSDGLGNDSTLSLSTAAASIAGTLAVTGNATFDTNTLFVDAASNEVGVGTASPAYRFNVVTDEVAGRQNLAAIDRTAQNFVTFTNPAYSVDSSMGLMLRVFPQSDARQGAGILASGGGANGETDLGLFVSSGSGSSTSYSALNIVGSTGNVGIGTDAPEAKVDIKGSAVAGSVGMFIENEAASTTNNSADIFFGTWGGSTVAGITNARISAVNVNAGNAESNLDFYTYNGASSGKRVSITQNGLTFNGDTAAANALDDYEEGTWTMGVSFGGAAVGVITSVNTGTYTKIGRQVTVNGLVAITSKGSSTGTAKITGLPFTIGNSTGNLVAPSLRFDTITFTNQFQAYGGDNTTTISLEEITTLGVVTVLADTDFSNSCSVMVSLTYFV